jgi:O-antigen/teichoic acid export membrane protein
VGIAAQSLAFLIVARYLGKTNYGHLSTLTALMAVCSSWVQFGTVELMRRRVAMDPQRYPEALGHSLIVLFIFGSIATLLISIVLTFVVHLDQNAVLNFLIIWLFASSTLLLYPWMVLVEQIFLAHNQFTRANLTNAGFGAWRVIVAAVGCLGFGVHTLGQWAIWNFGAYACGSLVGALAVARFGPPKMRLMKDEIPIGATFGVSGFLYSFRANVDVLSLSAVAPPEVVGTYGLARKVISIAFVTSASLDRLIYSTLVKDSQEGLRRTASSAVKFAAYAVVIAGFTAVALYILAPIFIPMLFGPSYKDAAPMVRLLCGIIVVVALQNLAFDALNSSNLHKVQVAMSTFFVSVGAAILALLTRKYAVPGAILGVYIMEGSLMVALWTALFSLAHFTRLSSLALFSRFPSQPPG